MAETGKVEPGKGEPEGLARHDSTGPEPLDERLLRTEKLLEEYQATVFRYAFRLSGCGATAEDIVQEVFLRAFRSLHQLRDESAALGWLLTIARNEFMRGVRKTPPVSLSIEPPDPETTAADMNVPLLDQQEWVGLALEQLPEEFRLVLLMFYFEELSYAEIAEQLNIPMGTVMSRLSRGRSHLKQALERASTRVL